MFILESIQGFAVGATFRGEVFSGTLLSEFNGLFSKLNFFSLGLVGLAITYSIQITPILASLLTIFTETEKQMVRVERVSQYITETPREKEKSTNVLLVLACCNFCSCCSCLLVVCHWTPGCFRVRL